MEHDDLRSLLSPEGLRLLDSLPDYSELGDVVQTVSALRAAGHPPALVSVVLSQARLRSKARAKFGPFAERMLFTEAGLEQATRLRVAALHAGRYAAAGITRVADLGCGIGADALALSGLDIAVTAVDRDEVTAAVAAFNLAPWPQSRAVHASAEDVPLDDVDAVWLDPARRSEGRRLSDPADWMPSLDFAFGLAERMPVGVKLGPGIDRDLIPHDAEAQWVSVDREVVELGVWTGPLARAGVRRSALVLGAHGTAELTAEADSADAAVGTLGRYLYEPDGAVIRARLIGDLARALGGRMIDPTIAYVTTDEPVETAFAAGFEIVAETTIDRKAISRLLVARGIGTLEIKKRGVDIDPARFRTGLTLKGGASAVLFLTRVAGERRALLAARV
jgi:SAM-dependent methyltransferase